MIKIGIYDPYLDTLGGGERYILTIAEYFSQTGNQVDIFWNGNNDLIEKATQRFSLNLSNVSFVKDIFKVSPQSVTMVEDVSAIKSISQQDYLTPNISTHLNQLVNRFQILSKYDIIFYLSDGSIPFLFGKKNFIHFQVPFNKYISLKTRIINKIKFLFINKIICNSKFTENHINRFYSKNSVVLYPPVDTDKFESDNDQNCILSVGRFDNILNAKKQDVLIDAFKLLHHRHPEWKLILAGGSLEEPSKNKYLTYLKNLSKNLPVEFFVNPNFSQLKNIYSTAKIYWHAAGFNVNQTLHPEETEHFGISTVEAMASGLVPVVINRGGLPEIVTNGENGFLWENIDELVNKTSLLISDPKTLQNISKNAKQTISGFSKNQFTKHLSNLIKKI